MSEHSAMEGIPVKKKRKRPMLLFMLLLIVVLAILYLFWPIIRVAGSVKKLEDGFYSMRYSGSYGLDIFLSQGGAASDMAVADFVIQRSFHGLLDLNLQSGSFGCSTLSAASPDGEEIFGRNFDWENCTAMVVQTSPPDGYASISTVNMDFLDLGLNLSEGAFVRLMAVAAPYAPMDGMNEKGLCAAVLMIQDSPAFDQDTGKPDLTTTTAVRLLLDRAADVDEALALLEQYDLHASADMMVHFALADAKGRSVVVEYIDNHMTVVETPVATNFYLAPGDRYGIGTRESQIRYELLMERLNEYGTMNMENVRDAMDRVSKRNFDSDYASTEWSMVCNQSNGEMWYYHRENYDYAYSFSVR